MVAGYYNAMQRYTFANSMVKLRVGKQSTTAQLSTESYSDVYPDLGTTCKGKAYLFKLRRPFTFLFLQL